MKKIKMEIKGPHVVGILKRAYLFLNKEKTNIYKDATILVKPRRQVTPIVKIVTEI